MSITVSPQYTLTLGVILAEIHLAENMACKCLDDDRLNVQLLNAFVVRHLLLLGRHHQLHAMWARNVQKHDRYTPLKAIASDGNKITSW
jgi:hypothetical protein